MEKKKRAVVDKGILILIVVLILLSAYTLVGKISYIEIHNTFRYSVQLELKCNYNTIKRKFMYHKFYNLEGHSSIRIPIQNNSDCQLWPKLR